MIDQKLIDILACPACKSDIKSMEDMIVCVKCGRQYPIKNGIPIMIVEETRKKIEDKDGG